MSCDQWNINVAALAYRLAVVNCFQDGQPAGMFLNGPRQRIQVTRARMRSKLLPLWQRLARSLHRRINVRRGALRDRRDLFAGGGICSVEEHGFRRLAPLAGYEVCEPPPVAVKPRQRVLRVFRRWAIFHGGEFFSDAHYLLESYAMG